MAGKWKLTLIILLGAISLGFVFFQVPFSRSSLADLSLAFLTAKNNYSSVKQAAGDNDLGLSFSIKGVVNKVYVKVGDQVLSGDLLSDLDSSLTLAQLHEAQATVDIQKATLARLQAGSSPEDIAIAMSKVNIAQAGVDDAKKGLFAALFDTYTKSDDAVRAKGDQVFTTPRFNPQLILLTDGQTQTDMNAKRLSLEILLTAWKSSLVNVNPGDDLTQYLLPVEANLIQVRDFLSSLSVVLGGSYQDLVNSAATVRNWRFDIYTARTNLETVLKNLLAADGKLQNAQSTLTLNKAELAQKQHPAAAAILALEMGKISEAEAKVEELQASLKQMSLVAPRAGTISRIKIQAGTAVNSFSSVIFIK